jgi:leucine dehydrogenase
VTRHKQPSFEALMRYAQRLGFSEIHTKHDPISGLNAVIAVHTVEPGPAIGGTRFQTYANDNLTLYDALRLSSMMTVKSAFCKLPHGGAKLVINKPADGSYDREALFESAGEFVEALNGDYIASLDAGTDYPDMDAMAKHTKHVIGTTAQHFNPSIYTALGVFKAIEAAIHHYQKRDSIDGAIIAVQGAGHVAGPMIKMLSDAGAIVHCTDIQPQCLEAVANLPNVHIVAPEAIYDVPCDLFSPCALGGVINTQTLSRLSAKMIVGAANNQLAHAGLAKDLKARGILFIPDFAANPGGVISASGCYHQLDDAHIRAKVNDLYPTFRELCARADSGTQTTSEVAFAIAMENLGTFTKPKLHYADHSTKTV